MCSRLLFFTAAHFSPWWLLAFLIVSPLFSISHSSSFSVFHVNVDVVVQFYLWFKILFPLFWGIVMYIIMSLEQREIKLNKG